MDLVQGLPPEQFALEYERQVTDPALDPQEIVVSDDGGIDHHQVRGRGLLDIRDQVLPEADQNSDRFGVEIALGTQAADDEPTVADVVAGLLEQFLPVACGNDAGPTVDHPVEGLRLVLEALELHRLTLAKALLVFLSPTLIGFGGFGNNPTAGALDLGARRLVMAVDILLAPRLSFPQ